MKCERGKRIKYDFFHFSLHFRPKCRKMYNFVEKCKNVHFSPKCRKKKCRKMRLPLSETRKIRKTKKREDTGRTGLKYLLDIQMDMFCRKTGSLKEKSGLET